MAGLPTNRTDFSNYCLRKLGSGAIDINVTSAQIDDRVDEAIHYFHWHHYNGSEQVFLSVQITPALKAQGYIDLVTPTNYGDIIGVTRAMRIGYASNSVLTAEFAIASDALWAALRGDGMLSYQMLMSYRSLIQDLTSGTKTIRHNVHQKRVYIDMDWSKLEDNSWIVLEAYKALDFSTFPAAYSDPWLIEYATQKIKLQWGDNLGKYAQVQLPGGIVLNGDQIRQQAFEKLTEMETNVHDEGSLPVDFYVG